MVLLAKHTVREVASCSALGTGGAQMENRISGGILCKVRSQNPDRCGIIRLCCAVLLFLMAVSPAISRAQTQPEKPTGAEPIPEPAVAAILTAFDKYEVVAMPEAHGMKDIDDFIFALIRNSAFPDKVNDIAVECGNSLYQPILDRYIAGEDVPFTEARKVWRNTTQPACGMSGFFEEFFPLVRAINQKLAPAKRLRVLAGDSPIDWDQVKSFQEGLKFFAHRDDSIASVMEKEVLSKHRKALMLFGTFHLMHGTGGNAVSTYEKDYPNLTLVISDFGVMAVPKMFGDALAAWPIPSLARAKGTWTGALDLGHFYPPPTMIHEGDCIVHNEFPKRLQKPMESLVDAFLYMGPQDLRLKEQMPADIALDVDYRMELLRRESLPGVPGALPGTPIATLKEEDQRTLRGAENPLLEVYHPPDPKAQDPELSKAVQGCLDRKNRGSAPQ